MKTRVSTKGQVVLPSPVRRRLGLQTGDPLDVAVEGRRIILTARPQRKPKARIIENPETGLPVITFGGAKVPKLTSRQVAEMLSNFP